MTETELFEGNHVLENERARLEPLTEKHFRILLPVALEKELWAFTSVTVRNEQEFEVYFRQAMREKEKHMSYPFAIYDKLHQCYAGSTRYANMDFENKRLEIGWTWYHPKLQRTGINKNCKFLLLEFAFNVLGFNRVELKTALTNLKSQGAMLKIGAVKEGILRRHSVNWDGTLRDTVYFSFIKEEWPEVKQKFFPEFL